MAYKLKTDLERFEAMVEVADDGCWLWNGAILANGYAAFHIGSRSDDTRRMVKAYRWSYEHFVGTIGNGLQIDHLCRVRHCVNPEHLEAVTSRTNVLRGDTVVARNAAKTHCIRGHPFDERNTLITPHGHRSCRTCARETMRGIRAARKG